MVTMVTRREKINGTLSGWIYTVVTKRNWSPNSSFITRPLKKKKKKKKERERILVSWFRERITSRRDHETDYPTKNLEMKKKTKEEGGGVRVQYDKTYENSSRSLINQHKTRPPERVKFSV